MQQNEVKYRWCGSAEHRPEVRWVLQTFASYAGISWCEDPTAALKIGADETCEIRIHTSFFDGILQQEFSPGKYIEEDGYVHLEGTIDPIATAFYYLNCLWERAPEAKTDRLGRHEFRDSLWKQQGLTAPIPIVNEAFALLAKTLSVEITAHGRSIFLSHDIDVVYGSWKENGRVALKKGRLMSFLGGIFRHVAGKPDWFNFDLIASKEQEHGYLSTFFWIPTKGKVEGMGHNADYDIRDPRIISAITKLKKQGFEHGLHKSLAPLSFSEEVALLGFDVQANRHHFLHFTLEKLIVEMEHSGLKMDASLGYAEVSGYRNGYSMPFVPYHLAERRPCTFVEVPLTFMDGTYSKYQDQTPEDAEKRLLEQVEKLPENAVISILWHNSHFNGEKYEGYGALYSRLLAHFRSEQVPCTNPQFLINSYLNVHDS